MADTLKIQEEIDLGKIRAALNALDVKLWEPPYLNEDTKAPEEDSLHGLFEKLNLEDLNEECVYNGLKILQQNALEKLAAKERFSTTGVASLKIKCSKGLQSDIKTVEVDLSSDGKELLEKLGKLVGMETENIRVICKGRVVQEQGSLYHQGLRNNSTIMLVRVGEDKALNELAEQRKTLEQIKNDARRLGERSSKRDEYYLEIADQSGKVIEMPPEENKALTVAMSLHEKGKASLKKKDYSTALVLLLEADAEFKNCRSSILDMVDNYAILNLDIVWCYLCLQNVSEIADAMARLDACEKKFEQSYGKNLERLSALKGTTGNETSLLMRLHLMQGIVAFHRGQTSKAKGFLMKCKSEYSCLTVDEESLVHLCGMGYNAKEARLALRASNGDKNMAVDFILKRREAMTVAKQEQEEQARSRKLGKCLDGSWVNAGYHAKLVEMGFCSVMAAGALRQANNGLNQAVQLLQEHPELVQVGMQGGPGRKRKIDVTDEMVAKVAAVGFQPEMAKNALMKEGCVDGAVAALLDNGGVAEEIVDIEDNQIFENGNIDMDKRRFEDRDAFGRIKNDMPECEDDYLDLDLLKEYEFLQQYLQLLPNGI